MGEAQARVAAMLLLTLRGTPTLYYGDELGIGDVHIPPGRIRDPWARNEPEASFNRDEARTPMQWSAEDFSGFSQVEPWLPLTKDYRTRNVDRQQGDGGSVLSLYRSLLSLRAQIPDLRQGAYRPIDAGPSLLAYRRGEQIAVVLNLSDEAASLELPDTFHRGEVLLRASSGETGGSVPTRLSGNEGLIIRAASGAINDP